MLRHRALLIAAICFATLSAGGLGAGLLGLGPVLKNILPTEKGVGVGLRAMAAPWVKDLAAWGIHVPQSWVDALPSDRYQSVVLVVALLGVMTVIGAVCNFLHAYFSLTVVSRVIATIRRDAYRRAIHLPLPRVVIGGSSDTVSRIVYDTATLAGGFNALLSRAVAQVTKGLAALAAAFVLDWRLSLIAVPLAVVLGAILKRLGKRIRRASKSALSAYAGLYRTANETLAGLRVVKVSGTERKETGRFHRLNKDVVRQELKVRTARALSSPLIEVLAIFVLGALALVAARQIIDGVVDARNFLLVFAALGMTAAQLKPLTGIINDIQQASAASDRIAQLLAEPLEPGHGRNADGVRLPALTRPSRTIAFEDVTLTYPGAETPALAGVTLSIQHGSTVAFVGPNGSGKTTLLSLIPRLFDPDSGRVLVDGTDIRDVAVRSLRRHIGVVTQDVVLFQGSIRENIAYGADPEPTLEQVRDAARRARAEEFILDKPRGYDTPLAEGGAGLSGGQRQRISIARAILRDPAILILDEATSMVDADSEAKIAEAVTEFVGRGRGAAASGSGRTCLIVAHRLSTVMNADLIVVMDGGRIVDKGRHAELLSRCETYRLIANNQLLRPPPPAAEHREPEAPAA